MSEMNQNAVNCNFEIENGVLIKYWGCEEDVTIPDNVIRIGGDAFRGCDSIKNVIIPNSVREIGDCAFGWCASLESVTLSENLERIAGHLFEYCLSFPHETGDGGQCL